MLLERHMTVPKVNYQCTRTVTQVMAMHKLNKQPDCCKHFLGQVRAMVLEPERQQPQPWYKRIPTESQDWNNQKLRNLFFLQFEATYFDNTHVFEHDDLWFSRLRLSFREHKLFNYEHLLQHPSLFIASTKKLHRPKYTTLFRRRRKKKQRNYKLYHLSNRYTI